SLSITPSKPRSSARIFSSRYSLSSCPPLTESKCLFSIPKKPVLMTSSLETYRYGRSVKYIRCIALSPFRQSAEKSFHFTQKISRFLDFRPMAAIVEHTKSCGFHHPLVLFGGAERHNPVLASQDYKRRQTRRSPQQSRQMGILNESV